MTQADFAKRIAVDRKTVVRWEAGERLPDGASLLALASEFSADVNYILTGQRSAPVAPQELLSEGDRILLANYHAVPAEVQRGVKITLDACAHHADHERSGGQRKRA